MNNMIKIALISSVILLAIPTKVLAQDKPQHSVGLTLSGGGAEYKNSKKDGDGIVELYAHYNYALTPQVSLEFGVASAVDIDDWKCKEQKDQDKWVCSKQEQSLFGTGADKLAYTNAVAAVKGYLPLTDRQGIYAKLGAQYYDYELKRGSTQLDSENGIGALASAGWQYRWNTGLGLDVGLSYKKMADLKVLNTGVGISYSF